MTLLHLITLALVQGITEFLPISSSAHLILVPMVLGDADQGLAIDVAAHVGTLGAVMLYFRRDVAAMLKGGLRILKGNIKDPGAQLGLMIAAATAPVVIAGYVVHEYAGDMLRSPYVIAATTLIFGAALWAADRYGKRDRDMAGMTWKYAILIGLSQVLALVPGTSRSGITMTAARALGYERADAARFSMLLSIPTIAGAGTLAGMDLAEAGDSALTGEAAAVAVLSFLAALAAIHLLMKWLEKAGFMPFVIYRFVLGAALIIAFWP